MGHIAITGAAAGIGAACVTRLMAAGHQVTAFDIIEPAGVDNWVAVDMGDLASVAAAAEQVEGPFDALINNAGLPPKDDNAAEILAVNVLGLRAFNDALLPRLANGAAIVSTASRAGQAWAENIDEVKALLALESREIWPVSSKHAGLTRCAPIACRKRR